VYYSTRACAIGVMSVLPMEKLALVGVLSKGHGIVGGVGWEGEDRALEGIRKDVQEEARPDGESGAPSV
jgi:hypothetical protein